MKLGIDIGGTFTDLVLMDDTTGRLHFGKTLTTYPDPAVEIMNGDRRRCRVRLLKSRLFPWWNDET